MASGTHLLYCTTYPGYDSAHLGLAVPFGWGINRIRIDSKIGMGGFAVRVAGPLSVFAHGLSMPISRGSPPLIYD